MQLAYTCENDDLGESDHSFRLTVELSFTRYPRGSAFFAALQSRVLSYFC